MKEIKVNIIFRMIDILLWPFMFILGGFKFPVQETHAWHVMNWKWTGKDILIVKQKDKKAKFGHTAPLGLFHMPIFGGLTKCVVIEASGFDKYWYIGWQNNLHRLKIHQKKITMLVGKEGFIAYGLGDNGKNLKLKIVGYADLGDSSLRGLRLF